MTGLIFNGNRFISSSPSTPNTTRLSFSGGTFAAEGNWWGSAAGPADTAFLKDVTTAVDVSPWCSNESCTGTVTPVAGETATINDPDLGAPTFSWTGAAALNATVKVEPIVNPAPAATPFKTDGARLISIQITGITPPVTICVDGSDPDRLWHFVDSAWQDITNDPAYVGGKVCGTAMSFSPFAIAEVETSRSPGFDIDLDQYRQREETDLPDTGSYSAQTMALLTAGLTLLAAGLTLLGANVIVRGRRSSRV
jgi:hypothetical protein